VTRHSPVSRFASGQPSTSLEHVFDYVAEFAAEEAEDRGTYPRHALRRVDPPLPVEIEVAQILPTEIPRWGSHVPIWARMSGIDLHSVPGLLYAWVLTQTGTWCGICSVELRSQDGRLRIALPRQIVPRKALRRLSD
jgi:hypothetical protein